MKIKITKNIKEANLITHSSSFHPDDVFSTVLLSKIVDNPVVCRTVDVSAAPAGAIIYDIGFGRFDHHGPDAKSRKRPKIKYCSFGLLWQEYGRDYLKDQNPCDLERLWTAIDNKLVMQIDAIDNGIFPEVKAEFHLSDLDKIIDTFNKGWDEDVDNDDMFLCAVEVAEKIFDRIVIKENARLRANLKVEEAIEEAKDGLLILKDYLPYDEALWHSTNPKAKDIKVVIFPSNRGGFSIKPRTVSASSKELAYNFPKSYWGLHDEKLAEVSKIKTARFVHLSGFLACTNTLEDAIAIAKIAINNKE